MNRLAIETSTEQLSVAVSARGQVWSHQGPGGAQASAGLLAAVHQVLAQAGLALDDMVVIAMGRGPGSFTGLRTACSVSQGLAFGLGVGILPIDTLLALADEGRHLCAAGLSETKPGSEVAGIVRFYAVIDARMGQLYTAAYEHRAGRWHTFQAPAVQNPADCALPLAWSGQPVWAVGMAQGLLPCCAWPTKPRPKAPRCRPPWPCRCTCATRWPRPALSAPRPKPSVRPPEARPGPEPCRTMAPCLPSPPP